MDEFWWDVLVTAGLVVSLGYNVIQWLSFRVLCTEYERVCGEFDAVIAQQSNSHLKDATAPKSTKRTMWD